MFEALRQAVLTILKLPTSEPLPPAGTVGPARIFRASPRYFTYTLLIWALRLAPMSGALLIFLVGAQQSVGGEDAWLLWCATGLIGVVLLLQFLLGFATMRLDYELRWYVVTDRALRIREGVWQLREMTLTFANVQNLTISQGPLQRIFGISDLVVQTAGGESAEAAEARGYSAQSHRGVLRGLEDPQAIRDLVQAHVRSQKATSVGEPEEPAAERAPSVTAPSLDMIEALREVRDEAHKLRLTMARAPRHVG